MSYQTFTLSDIKTKLSDRTDGVPFWTETEALDGLNEALLVWNSLTGFWKDRVSIVTTVGQNQYNLPSSMVFGIRVEYNLVPLSPTSLVEMDNGRPGWGTQTGTPKYWMPIDLNTIKVWPAPTSNQIPLVVDGVSATPILEFDDDFVQIGADGLDAILGYALHFLAFKEGGERFQQTMEYFNRFLASAAEQNSQLMNSEMFRTFLGLDLKREEEPTR